LPPNTAGLYPWWGTTFSWSPDGSKLAYARADQVGVINLPLTATTPLSGNILPLMDFPPLQTFSDWVWLPSLSWSPDSQFIAATIHGAPLASEPAEESQVFDVWVMSADGRISVKMVEQAGMWANPTWNQAGIAFGMAFDPLQSVNSRYRIELIDRDGSNKRQLFPFREELGVQFPELIWSPDGKNLLFIYNGNLFMTSAEGGLPKQLTSDEQASHPQWALAQSLSITETLAISQSAALTGSTVLTGSTPLTETSRITPAPTLTPTTGTIRVTPTPTLPPNLIPALGPTVTPTRLTATSTFTPQLPAATATLPLSQTIPPLVPSQTPTATLQSGEVITATVTP
jgi:Tol biopolymer transport system component